MRFFHTIFFFTGFPAAVWDPSVTLQKKHITSLLSMLKIKKYTPFRKVLNYFSLKTNLHSDILHQLE